MGELGYWGIRYWEIEVFGELEWQNIEKSHFPNFPIP